MRLKIALLLSLLAVALPLHAAVVIVRSDEAMIRTAPAIVTGTVVEVYARHDDRGDIETVTRILVDEAIKGTVAAGEIVDVVQFGGALDGRFAAQSGAPKYEVGARYFVVLDRNGRGLWTTFDLALGQFRFVMRDGKQMLARDTSEIVGWSESGKPFYDSDRSAPEFLAFARDVAQTARAHSVMELHPAPLALDYDLKSVTQNAVNVWTGGASAMNDTVSATPAGGDTKNVTDGESRVIADDPHGDLPGTFNGSGLIAIAFFGCTSCAPSTKNGETYISIDQMDVVVNDGVSTSTLSSGNFLSTMVHEIGHTWGFRHSNKNAADSGSCAAPLPCATNAIMNTPLVSGLNGALQSWDRDAANEVYGDGTRQATFTGTQYVTTLGGEPPRRPSNTSWRIWQAACSTPTISVQPQSQTINSGQQANLSVTAGGTGPLSYLWYTGTPPSGPVAPGPNNTSSTYNPSPTSTTTYWVRVTNSCGHTDSAVATVTVNQTGCTPPSISTQPQGQTILAGQQVALNVGATGTGPFTYQWYIGNPPNTATPAGTGQSINVSPTQTTTYWVRVTGQCAPPADSNAATITVSSGCTAPVIVNNPPDQQITSGTSTSLFVGYSGSPSTVTWYRGAKPDQSNPVGTGQSFITGVLTTTTQFWALVSNGCGTAQSRTVTVTVTTSCVAPLITLADAGPKNVAPGVLVTLTAQATGTGLQFQWYRGTKPDFSNPVPNGNTSTATDTPQVSTSYFVHVSNSCGSQDSDSIAITVTTTPVCTPPSITGISADATISSNMTATLEVAATGDPTLHYQWYQGPSGTTTTPVGTDSPTYTTPSLFAETQYWVKVSSACAPPANSSTVTVSVIAAKRRAARH